MVEADWPEVCRIYLEGLATGLASYETNAPEWERWNSSHSQTARLVARRGGAVVGWAALTPVSSRCVYAGVAEVSVYVAEAARGTGVGRALMAALVQATEQAGIWTLQAGVFPENQGSIALCASAGFRVVGIRERLAKREGQWRDVALLERRSQVVGL